MTCFVVMALVGMQPVLAFAQGTVRPVAGAAVPAIGNDAVSRDHLRAARVALLAGHSVEAGQSLALAELSAISQPGAADAVTTPNAGLYVARIRDARRALGNGDSRYAVSLIDVALLH